MEETFPPTLHTSKLLEIVFLHTFHSSVCILLWKMATEMESALIFLGTGSSGSVPYMSCLIEPSDPPCSVCTQSLSLPPQSNPNYRYLTSSLPTSYQLLSLLFQSSTILFTLHSIILSLLTLP